MTEPSAPWAPDSLTSPPPPPLLQSPSPVRSTTTTPNPLKQGPTSSQYDPSNSKSKTAFPPGPTSGHSNLQYLRPEPPSSSSPSSSSSTNLKKQSQRSTATGLSPALLYSLSADSRTSRDSVRTEASTDSRQPLSSSSGKRSASSTRSGFLSLAALAREKTSSALKLSSSSATTTSSSSSRPPPAPHANASFHSVSSSNTLARSHSTSSFSSSGNTIRPSNTSLDTPGGEYYEPPQSSGQTIREFLASSPPPHISSGRPQHVSSDAATPFENQPYTSSVLEPSKAAYGAVNKMHQTSSRLLRMTEDERPFTRVSYQSISFANQLSVSASSFRAEGKGFAVLEPVENYRLPALTGLDPMHVDLSSVGLDMHEENVPPAGSQHLGSGLTAVQPPAGEIPGPTGGGHNTGKVPLPITDNTVSHNLHHKKFYPQINKPLPPLPAVSKSGWLCMDGVDKVEESNHESHAQPKKFLAESHMSLPSSSSSSLAARFSGVPIRQGSPAFSLERLEQAFLRASISDTELFHIKLIFPMWSDASAYYIRHPILPAKHPNVAESGLKMQNWITIQYLLLVESLPTSLPISPISGKHNDSIAQGKLRLAALELQRTHCVTHYDHRFWEDRLRLDIADKGKLPSTRINFDTEKFMEGRHVYQELRQVYQSDKPGDFHLLDMLIFSLMPEDVARREDPKEIVEGSTDPRPNHFPAINFFVTEFELAIVEQANVLCFKDFKDLFATLMVSLPLTPHRVRFQRVDHTFSSEEAINNLGSLKFSQSNRMPDPKDPSRIVTTTTTTTFSMAREMARSVCQRFLDARFIESADGKLTSTFPLKNGVWQLTPKGMHILQRFCQRNGINQRHVMDLLESSRNSMQLVILERDVHTDKLSHDKATIEVIFRRFAGQDGPNVKQSASSADSDSLSDYGSGLTGVKMAKERKLADKVVHNTFTGKATIDWLMDCCCTIDRRETCEIAKEFVHQGLIKSMQEDKQYAQHNPRDRDFQPTKGAIYGMTEKGQKVAGWLVRQKSDGSDKQQTNGTAKSENKGSAARDSNTNRLTVILSDPALRLLFREFLRDTHCEENLAFYLDVVQFTSSYRAISRQASNPKVDTIREIRESLAAAYGLYNAFLAPGSPCELNIDHNLRNNLAGRMTRAVGDDEAMSASLRDVAKLFDEAQNSVFKLMSSDSVPKFLKDPRYSSVLREHDFDAAMAEWQPSAGAAQTAKAK